MGLDRDLIDAVRDLDDHELRRLLILARARLEMSGALPPASQFSVILRQQAVRSGKASCTRCPHGPYWYAYWTENGRRRSRYIGRLLEEE